MNKGTGTAGSCHDAGSQLVEKNNASQLVQCVFSFPEGTYMNIAFPLHIYEDGF